MKRIAIVTSEFFIPDSGNTGGLGSYVWNIANYLNSKGIEVFIYTKNAQPLKDKMSFGQTKVHLFPFVSKINYSFKNRVTNYFWIRFKKRSYFHYDRLKREAKLIHHYLKEETKKYNFDLIQYSNLGGIGYYPIKEVPTILRISSLTDLYWKFGKGYYGLSEQNIRAQIKIENESYRKFKTIIGPCKRMLSFVEVKAQKIHLLSPFSTILFKNNDSKILNKSLSFFGSVDYRKGADLFLDIVEEFSSSLSRVIIAGKLYEDTEENHTIKYRVKNSSLIEFYENLQKPKLFQLLSEIDIVILPSRVDNLPNTLLESIQMGKIVIGPDSWGFDDVIVSGYNGFLFNEGSREDLFRKVRMVLGLNMEEKEKIRINARETFHRLNSEKSSDKIFRTYLKIFEDN